MFSTLPLDGTEFRARRRRCQRVDRRHQRRPADSRTLLEIGPDGPDSLPADHPKAVHLEVYQWLTVLQEYLVLGLMGKPIR